LKRRPQVHPAGFFLTRPPPALNGPLKSASRKDGLDYHNQRGRGHQGWRHYSARKQKNYGLSDFDVALFDINHVRPHAIVPTRRTGKTFNPLEG